MPKVIFENIYQSKSIPDEVIEYAESFDEILV